MAKSKKSEENFFKKYGMFLIIAGLLIVFLVVMLVTGGNDKKKETNKSGDVKTATVAEWLSESKGNETVVAVFAQTTCSWCEQYKPVVQEVIAEQKADIYWFDVDTITQEEYASLGEAYSELKEFGTPYTLITKSGKKVGEISGYVEKDTLVSKLKEVGVLK